VHLAGYATEGLRTLVLASREITEEQWREWNSVHQAASTALENREEALENAAELIEKDMIVLGATAIEDKLQVCMCIHVCVYVYICVCVCV
jgi:magnesium-transporting ATPase (P-type)